MCVFSRFFEKQGNVSKVKNKVFSLFCSVSNADAANKFSLLLKSYLETQSVKFHLLKRKEGCFNLGSFIIELYYEVSNDFLIIISCNLLTDWKDFLDKEERHCVKLAILFCYVSAAKYILLFCV